MNTQRGLDLFITSMITDRIGRHEGLLLINHKIIISEKEEWPSYQRKGTFALKD